MLTLSTFSSPAAAAAIAAIRHYCRHFAAISLPLRFAFAPLFIIFADTLMMPFSMLILRHIADAAYSPAIDAAD
jgi:hypothetical protein